MTKPEQLFNPGAKAAAEPVRYWTKRLARQPGMRAAISLQIARRNHREWKLANIKEVPSCPD